MHKLTDDDLFTTNELEAYSLPTWKIEQILKNQEDAEKYNNWNSTYPDYFQMKEIVERLKKRIEEIKEDRKKANTIKIDSDTSWGLLSTERLYIDTGGLKILDSLGDLQKILGDEK